MNGINGLPLTFANTNRLLCSVISHIKYSHLLLQTNNGQEYERECEREREREIERERERERERKNTTLLLLSLQQFLVSIVLDLYFSLNDLIMYWISNLLFLILGSFYNKRNNKKGNKNSKHQIKKYKNENKGKCIKIGGRKLMRQKSMFVNIALLWRTKYDLLALWCVDREEKSYLDNKKIQRL